MHTTLKIILRIGSFLLGILTLPLLLIGIPLFIIGYFYMFIAIAISIATRSRRPGRNRRSPDRQGAREEDLFILGPHYLAVFICRIPITFFDYAGLDLLDKTKEKKSVHQRNTPPHQPTPDPHQQTPDPPQPKKNFTPTNKWAEKQNNTNTAQYSQPFPPPSNTPRPTNSFTTDNKRPKITNGASTVDWPRIIAVLSIASSLFFAILKGCSPDSNRNALVGGQPIQISYPTPDLSSQRTAVAPTAPPLPHCDPTAGCESAAFYDFSGFAYIASVDISKTPAEITPDQPLEITITWFSKSLEDLPEDEKNVHTAADYQTVIIWEDAQGNKLAESRQTPQNGAWGPNQEIVDQHTLSFENAPTDQNSVLYIGIIDANTNRWIPTQFGDMIPLDPNKLHTIE